VGYWNDTYTTLKPRLTDWLRKTGGGSVTDLELDLSNRALLWLWQYRDWDDLIQRLTVTLDSSLNMTLPAALGRIVNVYWDTDSDNVIEGKFNLNDVDEAKNYIITDTFTKAVGHSRVIHFPRANHTPVIKYVATLEALTGSGTEYLFFPAELMLRTAQRLRIEEKGITGVDTKSILEAQERELNNYTDANYRRNVSGRFVLKDSNGDEVFTENLALDGSDTGMSGVRRPSDGNDVRWA